MLVVTIPRSGLESDLRVSATTNLAERVSPGRTGRCHRNSSAPAPPKPACSFQNDVAKILIIKETVCQPEAKSPPNGPPAAVTGSVWIHWGSYCRAKSITSCSERRIHFHSSKQDLGDNLKSIGHGQERLDPGFCSAYDEASSGLIVHRPVISTEAGIRNPEFGARLRRAASQRVATRTGVELPGCAHQACRQLLLSRCLQP